MVVSMAAFTIWPRNCNIIESRYKLAIYKQATHVSDARVLEAGVVDDLTKCRQH